MDNVGWGDPLNHPQKCVCVCVGGGGGVYHPGLTTVIFCMCSARYKEELIIINDIYIAELHTMFEW